MGKTLVKCAVAALILGMAPFLFADDEVRLASGVPIKGEARDASAEGLDVETPTGLRTFPWNQLSAATRYRYDPKFRANYELILQGLPPSARTIKPIEEVHTEDASATTSPKGDGGDGGDAQGTVTMKIFDNLIYENINPISVKAFRGLRLQSPDLATYWGLQYGPSSDDIVYLGFDTKGIGEPHDTLFVFTPTSSLYKDTVTIRGTRKKDGNERVVDFKAFSIESKFGLANTTFDIDCDYTTRKADALSVTIRGELEGEGVKNTFLLYTEPNDLISGDGIIRVRGIVDLPVLWISLDPTSTQPRLVGTLKMSRMTFIPKQGMDSRVNIKLTDQNGNVVQSEQVKLDEDKIREKYTIQIDLDDVTPGQKYRAEASISLGPFLGEVSYRSNITIPRG